MTTNVRTAVLATIVGIVVAVGLTMPTIISAPLLAAVCYVCGVLDGRSSRRGGWLANLISAVRDRARG